MSGRLSRYGSDVRPYFEALWTAATYYDRAARITSTIRSRAEQARLYRRYLAGLSRFPAAPPGSSLHEKGLAIDIVAGSDTLRTLGREWQSLGPQFRWGGDSDPIHFEIRP